jgi:hypothetical protein
MFHFELLEQNIQGRIFGTCPSDVSIGLSYLHNLRENVNVDPVSG